MKTRHQMKTRRVYDPITHEPLGIVLTTDPDLWAEWVEPPPPPQTCEHDDTSWATLYGIEED